MINFVMQGSQASWMNMTDYIDLYVAPTDQKWQDKTAEIAEKETQ